MAKPVRPRVLLARLRAHLRKKSPAEAGAAERRIEFRGLVIDASRRVIQVAGEVVELTTAEFELLWLLAERAGQALSRNEIFSKLHGVPYDGFDRSIDLRISRLRKKLGDETENPQRIKSIRSVGYQLSADP